MACTASRPFRGWRTVSAGSVSCRNRLSWWSSPRLAVTPGRFRAVRHGLLAAARALRPSRTTFAGTRARLAACQSVGVSRPGANIAGSASRLVSANPPCTAWRWRRFGWPAASPAPAPEQAAPWFRQSGPAAARHVLTRGQLRGPLCAPFSPRPRFPRRASRFQAVAANLRGDGGSGPCWRRRLFPRTPSQRCGPQPGTHRAWPGLGGSRRYGCSHGNSNHLALCGRPLPCGALAAVAAASCQSTLRPATRQSPPSPATTPAGSAANLPPGSGHGPTPGPSRYIGGRGSRNYSDWFPRRSILPASRLPAP